MKTAPFFTVLMFLQALSFMGKACIHTRLPLPGVTSQTSVFTHNMPLVDQTLLRQFVIEQMGTQTEPSPCKSLDCADLVAAYAYLGEYDEALHHSKSLLAANPEDYGVLINHALILELQGKYKEALKYLKKAIALAPDENGGAEWIHQLVLEKRVAGKNKPKASLLGLDFGNEVTPTVIDSLMADNTLRDQLDTYINANLYFAQKPDPLFASILYDYANLVASYNMGSHENYIQADAYGCTDTTLPIRLENALQSKQQMEAFQQQMDTMGSIHVIKKPNMVFYLKILGLVVSLLGFVVHFLRKRGE